MSDNKPSAIVELSNRIWPQVWDLVAPQIKGRGPGVQGGVLSDLMARLLVGHTIPGNPQETYELRERLLALHVEYVRALIPINARNLGTEVTHDAASR
jgi:hypothetical protein